MSWLKLHNPTIDWPEKRVVFNSKHCNVHCIPWNHTMLGNVSGSTDHLEGIPEEYLEGVKDCIYAPLEDTPGEIGGAGEVSLTKTPLKGIPMELCDYADVFSEDKVTELPPHCPYDLEIVLQDPSKLVK